MRTRHDPSADPTRSWYRPAEVQLETSAHRLSSTRRSTLNKSSSHPRCPTARFSWPRHPDLRCVCDACDACDTYWLLLCMCTSSNVHPRTRYSLHESTRTKSHKYERQLERKPACEHALRSGSAHARAHVPTCTCTRRRSARRAWQRLLQKETHTSREKSDITHPSLSEAAIAPTD